MTEVSQGPRSSVFTTMRFSKRRGLFLFENHLRRLDAHAARLRIDTKDITQDSIVELLKEKHPQFDEGLLRVEVSSQLEINLSYRPLVLENERVDGVTFPSPVWAKRVAGTKHGAWDAYFDARKHAENLGADLALMVHEYCIVDADRCTPLILDEDGVIWHSSSPNSVDSITFDAMRSSLLAAGYHIQTGKLNERLVARCVEAVAVGSGVGVFGIDSIDGEPIGDGGSRLFDLCKSILKTKYNDVENWQEVWT
jgi:branched-subunit amino acid aminotransferase/4-amino-4-deoxychorismate lyase